MAAKTRKVRSASKALKIDTLSKVPGLEKLLKSGKLTVVLIYADWCGACQRFKKDIWEPMCTKPAVNNRVAIRDDILPNTSLSNAKIQYLPSILMVDEKGGMSEMPGPKGEPTNAVPTPKSLQEMTTMVNATPGVASPEQIIEDPIPKYLPTKDPLAEPNSFTSPTETVPLTLQGKTYTPSIMEPSPNMVSPLTLKQTGGGMVGGKFLQTLRRLALGKTRIWSRKTRRRRGHK